MNTQNQTQNPLDIIVVDDSEFSRKSVATILESVGHNIIGEASNAEETFELLNTTSPNLIIIDVVMPDVTGIELAKHINENFEDISLIMMSSLGQEHIIIESISAGAIDFIQKPFRKEDLLVSIEKVAGQRVKDKNR